MEYSNQRKELKVSAIENGTVIDHIPANSVFRATRILRLDKMENQVLVGTYLDSKKYGKRELLRLAIHFLKMMRSIKLLS